MVNYISRTLIGVSYSDKTKMSKNGKSEVEYR